ncbi:HisA/HisF-related TIM barrel protein, partial [Bacillus altitudinis]
MMRKGMIGCVDVKEGGVVKGMEFVGLKDGGDGVELGEMYEEEGGD